MQRKYRSPGGRGGETATRASTSAKRRAAGGDERAALDLAMQMMAIPGPSGQEEAIVEFISGQLRKAGAKAADLEIDTAHLKTPVGGRVGNLIFKLPGTVRAPRRLLMAHVDTVPVCVGSRPVLKGRFVHSGDPATGLGADDRAGAAVVLLTALEILRRKLPHPPLTFLWTVQEEVGLYGARYVKLAALGKPRLAFNWDGTQPEKLTLGATGGYRTKIDVYGRASHAGVAPEEGISAIAIASLAIADLVRGGWHGQIRKGDSQGTSNVGVIQGGNATNVVTSHVQLRAEARSHDPAFRQRIIAEIENAFQRAADAVKSSTGATGRVQFDGQLDYEAFLLPADEPCVAAADRAVRAAGLEPVCAVANGGLDANWMTARGVPTVTLGCGQTHIHTVDEQLDVNMFHQARRIALGLATGVD